MRIAEVSAARDARLALTTTDAFFVAYQEQSGIQMHFGVEVELRGVLDRAQLDRALEHAVGRWPVLARRLVRGFGGLRWATKPMPLLSTSTDPGDLARRRNTRVDPFAEPPFGVLWIDRGDDHHALAFRCHHAAADGQLFVAIVCEILIALARQPAPHTYGGAPRHPLAFRELWRDTRLAPSMQHVRWLANEARAARSARISLAAVAPGPIAISDHRLDATRRLALFERARDERVRPPWLLAAAWLRAVAAWNERRGSATSLVSLEVPVNLRRGPRGFDGSGNHLAVLTLFADPRQSLGEVARALWSDYAGGLRRRAHLAVPLLTAPVRMLPWPLFRRVAVSPTSTGFATSHFTFLSRASSVHAEVTELSRGALTIADQHLYTPVCLRMGAALCVLDWQHELQLSVTHRLTGLSAGDARQLGELLVADVA